jgi:hypothetical protein
VYEITAKFKKARTSISLNSGPFPLKFSEILQIHSWLKQQKVQPILIPETLVDAPIKLKVTEEDKFNTVYSSLCVAYQISWINTN